MLNTLALLGAMAVTLGACTLDSQKAATEIVHHKPAKNDSGYGPAVDAATRHAQVYANFETQFFVHATLLTPSFRNAFHKRYQELFAQPQAEFGEAANKAGFFVSLYAPDADKMDLDNQLLWTIAMEHQGTRSAPVHVRFLANKAQWSPFFPYISKWTREYFVVFEAPMMSPQSSELLEQNPVKLTMSNAEASVTMTW